MQELEVSKVICKVGGIKKNSHRILPHKSKLVNPQPRLNDFPKTWIAIVLYKFWTGFK